MHVRLLYFFPDTASRVAIAQPGHRYAGQTSLLYGMDQAGNYGHEAHADFEYHPQQGLLESLFDRILNFTWSLFGGSGGVWYRVLALRTHIREADLIISTADRIGIPLVLLMATGCVPKRPLLYISIGLPERLEHLSGIIQHVYRWAFRKTLSKMVCYGYEESQRLKDLLGLPSACIQFIPFGVDTHLFTPSPPSSQGPILSIGADPNRDFNLLIRVATQITQQILIVTTTRRAKMLRTKWGTLPRNVLIRCDVPFSQIPSLIAGAKFVVLPLKKNSYSGATTTLLQCMAMAKTVIVSQTGAIADGYHLRHRENSLLVTPEDEFNLLKQIRFATEHPEICEQIGVAASSTVNKQLQWNVFVAKLFGVVSTIVPPGLPL